MNPSNALEDCPPAASSAMVRRVVLRMGARGKPMDKQKALLVLGTTVTAVGAGLTVGATGAATSACPGDCARCGEASPAGEGFCAPEGQRLCRGTLRECTGLGKLLKVCPDGTANRPPCPGPHGGPCALANPDPQAQEELARIYASAAAAEPNRLAPETLPRASFQRLPDIDK